MATDDVTTSTTLDAFDRATLNLSYTKAQLAAILALTEGHEDPDVANAYIVASAALGFVKQAGDELDELWELTRNAEKAA